jgi:hypothetical protein
VASSETAGLTLTAARDSRDSVLLDRAFTRAAGLTEGTAGLGAVGGYKDLAKYTTSGGTLFVFALPSQQRTDSTAALTGTRH